MEDYAVTIVGNPYKNQTNGLDVNGDGKVTPIDALKRHQLLEWSTAKGIDAAAHGCRAFHRCKRRWKRHTAGCLVGDRLPQHATPGGSGEGEAPTLDSAFTAGTAWLKSVREIGCKHRIAGCSWGRNQGSATGRSRTS